MFRTVIINKGERIRLKDNWLIVEFEDNSKSIPIDDIYSIVIDNQSTLITASVINAITNAGGHIIICDNKHIPSSTIYPVCNYYRPLTVLRNQIELSQECKNKIWRFIIEEKIRNQALVLTSFSGTTDTTKRLFELAQSVVDGDERNCEGVAAKLFFRGMYGSDFIRMNDDTINHALNYGYAIIRSSMSKSLIGHGFNCVLGIHHINIYNSFNLSDDLMEPLRPIVDWWVNSNSDTLIDDLTKEQRTGLANLVNEYVLMDGKTMQLRNAIEVYVKSLAKTIETEHIEFLRIPELQY